jgi:septal ring-binding cell division protein DamX
MTTEDGESPELDNPTAKDTKMMKIGGDEPVTEVQQPAPTMAEGQISQRIAWPNVDRNDPKEVFNKMSDAQCALDVALHLKNALERPNHFQVKGTAEADKTYYDKLPPEAKQLVDQQKALLDAAGPNWHQEFKRLSRSA